MPNPVNNEVYRRLGHAWWDDNEGGFSTIRFFVNPVRFGFVMRVLAQERAPGRTWRTLLDVGCGGGFLAEEFAHTGFQVFGIDPALESIEAARAHAAASGLAINYQTGMGENLPFAGASFDMVACCDVLEHVDDVERVVSEIARVLKPGGLFFYNTINRTIMSWIAVIKVMQEWSSTAFVEQNSHVWDRFIKPEELAGLLERYGLENREMRGISPCKKIISNWLNLRRRAQGKISFEELGRRLGFRESNDLEVCYMGYATKSKLEPEETRW